MGVNSSAAVHGVISSSCSFFNHQRVWLWRCLQKPEFYSIITLVDDQEQRALDVLVSEASPV